MTMQQILRNIFGQEDINFLLTNRIPRMTLTHFMGWFSQLRHPLLAKASIWVWRQFADLDLSEAKEQRFDSLHDCFIRQLRSGASPVDQDANTLVSPCDGIVGAMGEVKDGQLLAVARSLCEAAALQITLERKIAARPNPRKRRSIMRPGVSPRPKSFPPHFSIRPNHWQSGP